MRKPTLAVLIVTIWCFTFRTSADHPWFEIRSPHFTVICNATEKDGRDAAVDLERTRTVMIKSLPSLSRDPSAPLAKRSEPANPRLAVKHPGRTLRPALAWMPSPQSLGRGPSFIASLAPPTGEF
jgi:hypothetical protein